MLQAKPIEYTYGLGDIAARLGQQTRGPDYQKRYVQRLIERSDFPTPLPVLAGGELIDGIKPRTSRWLRAPVDQWFDDRLPPDAALREDRAARREADATMDERAANLGLRVVAGGRK